MGITYISKSSILICTLLLYRTTHNYTHRFRWMGNNFSLSSSTSSSPPSAATRWIYDPTIRVEVKWETMLELLSSLVIKKPWIFQCQAIQDEFGHSREDGRWTRPRGSFDSTLLPKSGPYPINSSLHSIRRRKLILWFRTGIVNGLRRKDICSRGGGGRHRQPQAGRPTVALLADSQAGSPLQTYWHFDLWSVAGVVLLSRCPDGVDWRLRWGRPFKFTFRCIILGNLLLHMLEKIPNGNTCVGQGSWMSKEKRKRFVSMVTNQPENYSNSCVFR